MICALVLVGHGSNVSDALSSSRQAGIDSPAGGPMSKLQSMGGVGEKGEGPYQLLAAAQDVIARPPELVIKSIVLKIHTFLCSVANGINIF